MADSLTYITTDFSNSADSILAVNGINSIRVSAHLDSSDTEAYCRVIVGGYSFNMVNKDFDGQDGEFNILLDEILPYLFTDVSDDELETGIQDVEDTFIENQSFVIRLYDSNGSIMASISTSIDLLFASPYFDSENGTYLEFWETYNIPNFIAQKNKTSYIYCYDINGDAPEYSFTKVGRIPVEFAMVDNEDMAMVDNDGNLLIYLE